LAFGVLFPRVIPRDNETPLDSIFWRPVSTDKLFFFLRQRAVGETAADSSTSPHRYCTFLSTIPTAAGIGTLQ